MIVRPPYESLFLYSGRQGRARKLPTSEENPETLNPKTLHPKNPKTLNPKTLKL